VVELLLTEKLADVVTSLGKKNKPKTLLEKETVKEWLERAREVNQDFVLRIQFSVLRKQEGFEPEESVLTGLRVSQPTVLSQADLTTALGRLRKAGEDVDGPLRKSDLVFGVQGGTAAAQEEAIS